MIQTTPSNIGTDVSRETLSALNAFADLILEWDAKHALVSIAQRENLHAQFLNCRGFVDFLHGNTLHLADIGSGNGLPAVLIALHHPRHRVTLVEANNKKAAFLHTVRQRLRLSTLSVLAERAEKNLPAGIQVFTAKAFSSLEKFMSIVRPKEAHSLLLAKGMEARVEISDLKRAWTFTQLELIPDETGSFLVWARGSNRATQQKHY